MRHGIPKSLLVLLCLALFLPLFDTVLPREWRLADSFVPIFIFALLGLGLTVLTGFTGLLSLGMAAFMAIGAYTFAILTCDIYPFQLGFWLALALTVAVGTGAGVILGLPTINLRGDYLAIVTLGFGEIVQDTLKNLESITKGTQGINPLPYPNLFGYVFQKEHSLPWYFFYLAILIAATLAALRLRRARIGRAWIAIREDELAATAMGVKPIRNKLLAFAIASAYGSLAGALWASYLGSSGEPGNYDFQISIIALCMVIVGGLGSIPGVIVGAVLMVGFNSIVLVKLSETLARSGLLSSQNVFSAPNNWKYLIFGLALVLTMRFRPEGLLPSHSMRREMKDRAGS
jgi:branched-chain amino acid transport system permease protein